MLRALAAGYQVERRLVDYDRGAVISALERLKHPGARWIVAQLRSEP